MVHLLADLFAILKSTDKLERAYVRDDISAKEYEPLCSKLIGQFKTLYETLREEVLPRNHPIPIYTGTGASPPAASGR